MFSPDNTLSSCPQPNKISQNTNTSEQLNNVSQSALSNTPWDNQYHQWSHDLPIQTIKICPVLIF